MSCLPFGGHGDTEFCEQKGVSCGILLQEHGLLLQDFVNEKAFLVAYYYKIVAYYYKIVVLKTLLS